MKKTKILIVDDEPDYCMIMRNYFLQKNYEVFIAFTLKEGLNMIENCEPDILFLDNNLPDGKGWTCAEEIANKMPALKIYLISAYHKQSDVIIPMANVTVWEKPISLNTLKDLF